ncbi:MAG: hypothetical protein RBU27_05460 [Bacteroidota bacterium]|nr:hypothetical protein [Bacteroidota bacterium]
MGDPTYLVGSGLTGMGYSTVVDEHRVRAAQLARERGYHPLMEAINAGLFENFDPRTFDTKRFQDLFEKGMDGLLGPNKKGSGETNPNQQDWYDAMENAWQRKLPQNKQKGNEIYRELLRKIYLNWAANADQPQPGQVNAFA